MVIDDGSLGALAACVSARIEHLRGGTLPSADGPVVWAAADEDTEGKRRREAAAAHAAHCEFDIVEGSVCDVGSETGGGRRETAMLLGAAWAAVRLGISRVVWPVHRLGDGESPSLEAAAKAVDRALLVTRLMSLDADEHGVPSFRIETPYADLTDRQMAELAADLDAPASLCWWHRATGTSSTLADLAATERRRWTALLSDAGASLPPA